MTQIDDKKQLETIDITKLLSLLPHRYPFLLIDRVVDINSDLSATGIKNVTFNEPYFMGHFPENPIMPGVLIIEAMAQTAGAISLLKLNVGKPGVVYFITIDKAKFRKPVKPGDQLKLHVKKIKERSGISRFDCIAEVDGIKVAEAEIAAMIAEDTGNE